MTLEAEISELQRENARVESQMLRLRSDISVMEAHLRSGDKVRELILSLVCKESAWQMRETAPPYIGAAPVAYLLPLLSLLRRLQVALLNFSSRIQLILY